MSAAHSSGALNSAVPYGPAVGDHIVLSAGLSPQQRIKEIPLTAEQKKSLLDAIQAWERWLDDCDVRAPKGYITYRKAGVSIHSTQRFAVYCNLLTHM